MSQLLSIYSRIPLSLAKRGRGDLLASLALCAVAKATFKRKRLWQSLIQPNTQQSLIF